MGCCEGPAEGWNDLEFLVQVLRALRRARKHRVESLPPSAFLLGAAERGAPPWSAKSSRV